MSKQTQTTKQPPAAHSAKRRRSTNGLLVALAVVAAVGIVGILNYVVYWQYRGLSPDARRWVRYDLTSTRRYSLSEQSRAVLDDLDAPHRMVTMLGGQAVSAEHEQRIRDLVDEYARASTRIEASHINLATETDRRAELLSAMDAMFARDTAPIRASILDGFEKLDRYAKVVDSVEASLKTIIDNGVRIRPEALQAQRLADLHSQYLRLQDQSKQLRAMRDQMLGNDWQARLKEPGSAVPADLAGAGEDLPDYTLLMSEIQRYAIRLADQTLPDTPNKADQLRRGITVDALAKPEVRQQASAAQNTLAALIQQVPELYKTIKAETDPLLQVIAPLRYDEARSVLNDKPCVLITSGDKARVLPAELLFRGAGRSDNAGQTSDLFVGEEQLTGAMISMKLDPPPLVVFIRSNTGHRALSATGPDQQRLEGLYDHVAKRLLSMDFELAEWVNPLRDDPPQALPGQHVVWVTLPYLKPDVNRRESMDHARKDKVAAFLTQRLAAGDSAMVMLSYNPDTDPRRDTGQEADSLVGLLKSFGLSAQTYQNVTRLSDESEDAGQSRYSSEFLIARWPESKIVGRSLDGIDTYFFTPMPIALTPTQGVKQIELAVLDLPAMYVQRTVPDRETGQFTPEPDSAAPRVVIGAAAQRDRARVLTIGDATWAMDNLTSLAILPDGSTSPDKADEPGARLAYPGNTDLFVNSICWLAHEEDLIAASPRTQDVRRITSLSDARVNSYRVALWAGMPGVVLILGVGVWVMRRRV